MSVERCEICERMVDTDFEEGVYDVRGFICQNCDEESNMKIKQVVANWFYTDDAGEEYETYTVGENGVMEIKEHKPQGEGDRWFYDVEYAEMGVKRVFNINSVSFVD